MAHKVPKNLCLSLSEAADFRLASVVCTKNEGEIHILNVQEKLTVSPGKHTASFAARIDRRRKLRTMRAKLPSTKRRRNLLVEMKEVLRRSTEKSEGIQYQSNCGMDMHTESPTSIDPQLLADKLPDIIILSENCNVVYFDLKTRGFSRTSEILQIAAKFGENTFSVYLNPSRSIDSEASEVTGLKNITGILYLHGKRVLLILPRDALNSFQEFLNLSSKPCILVAHNAPFDTAHLLSLIINNGMIQSFQNTAGFSDTLVILRRIFPERKKGEKMFKLQTLAQDLLKLTSTDQFHEALYDVAILEKLTTSFIKKEDLCAICKTYKQSVMTKMLLPPLKVLKGVISDKML